MPARFIYRAGTLDLTGSFTFVQDDEKRSG